MQITRNIEYMKANNKQLGWGQETIEEKTGARKIMKKRGTMRKKQSVVWLVWGMWGDDLRERDEESIEIVHSLR